MHEMLSRQFAELGLDDPARPPDPDRWVAFVSAVNRAYGEADRALSESRESMASLSGEMKSMNSHLLEEHDRLKTIVAAPGSAIIVYEADGTVGLINDEADTLLGPDPETLDNLCALVHSETREKLGGRDFWTMDAACRQITIPDATLRRADGSEVAIACVLTPIIQQARARGCVLAFKDMSERKAVEEKLADAIEENEELFAAITSILIAVGTDGTIFKWNAAAESALDLPFSEIQDLPFLSLPVTWDTAALSRGILDCRSRNQLVRLDMFPCRTRSGRDRLLSLTLAPIRSRSESGGVVILGTDLTERRELEAQLVQAQKLESIGQMAAGIAHEINTPTQFVGDNVQFLKSSFEDLRSLLAMYRTLADDIENGRGVQGQVEALKSKCREIDIDYMVSEIPGAIEESLNGVGRVAAIVRAMKEFSHPGSDTKAEIDLNRAIESTATVARNEWKYVSDLTLELDPDLPPVPCVIGEFNQVILNMIVNSAHAIRDVVGDGSAGKGRIVIATRRLGNHARIRISDTGAGIPAKNLDRIFDPFFTTKEVGKGTGQGLAIARNVIVKKHGGSIDVESEPGRGTTFTIHLPMKLEEEERAA